MIKKLIFLVGTILVSVTSEQICSVCGDGYQVGNPSALSSFPGHPDKPATCKEIEVAGLQGFIPISQCLSLPSLIFETCHCQAKTMEKTRKNVNAVNGPGHSSLRRVQWAPGPAYASTDPPVAVSPIAYPYAPAIAYPYAPANVGYSGSPVAAPSLYQYGGTPVGGYQYSSPPYYTQYTGPYQYTESPYLSPSAQAYADAEKRQSQVVIIIIIVTVVTIGAFAVGATMLNQNREPGNGLQIIATSQALPTIVPASSVVMNVHPARSTGTNGLGLDEVAKRRRILVLDVLFPSECKVCTTYLFRAVPFLPCHRKRNTSDASSPFFPQARRKNRRDVYSAWGDIS